MMSNQQEIKHIQGGIAVDDRGQVSFINDFDFTDVVRFYMVSNHQQGFVRAWHAHKKEAKYISVVSGAALIGAVKIDDWDNPSPDLSAQKFVLSEKKPSIIYIPSGYANGFMSLSDDCRIIFYSTSSLQDSLNDDWRYDARLWDIWQIEER